MMAAFIKGVIETMAVTVRLNKQGGKMKAEEVVILRRMVI